MTLRDVRSRRPEPVRLDMLARAVVFAGATLVAGVLLSVAGRGV